MPDQVRVASWSFFQPGFLGYPSVNFRVPERSLNEPLIGIDVAANRPQVAIVSGHRPDYLINSFNRSSSEFNPGFQTPGQCLNRRPIRRHTQAVSA